MDNNVKAELDRRFDNPAQHEGDVCLLSFRWDDFWNSYVTEWSDGVVQFMPM